MQSQIDKNTSDISKLKEDTERFKISGLVEYLGIMTISKVIMTKMIIIVFILI